ncbi:hypothetical protein OH77DRAFT_934997 [Trametes cingulata]|nr:hypothetical protein OH77DRAFT_934997 [Trametes cingulata]
MMRPCQEMLLKATMGSMSPSQLTVTDYQTLRWQTANHVSREPPTISLGASSCTYLRSSYEYHDDEQLGQSRGKRWESRDVHESPFECDYGPWLYASLLLLTPARPALVPERSRIAVDQLRTGSWTIERTQAKLKSGIFGAGLRTLQRSCNISSTLTFAEYCRVPRKA